VLLGIAMRLLNNQLNNQSVSHSVPLSDSVTLVQDCVCGEKLYKERRRDLGVCQRGMGLA
jgi:hypothetical protein